ncbi:MAG: cytochrome d ubiquinol oxidase subunit II [Chloroflexota bacterium]|nr:cytochrome d ubiquinol oxidase subunit II [Chloroflexota bacterium]
MKSHQKAQCVYGKPSGRAFPDGNIFSLSYHLSLFGIGLPLFLCIAEGLALKTKNPTWLLLAAFMLTSWGVAQYPYIIPPALTIEQAANAPQVIETLLIVMGIGMLIVVPALLCLFVVFKWSPATVIAGSPTQEGQSGRADAAE